jgi:putative FmdB family regulatory protein
MRFEITMPTYDYKCNACNHRFEQFQSMKDKTLRKCPKCGKNALERLIGTGAAILFKGSGFYQTDYRSESYKKAAEADSKPAAAASTSSSDSSTGGANANAKPAAEKPKAESAPATDRGSKGKGKKPSVKTSE